MKHVSTKFPQSLQINFAFIFFFAFCVFNSLHVGSDETKDNEINKFAILTIPKSGTHMINKYLHKLTGFKNVGPHSIEDPDEWVSFLNKSWEQKRYFAQHRFFSDYLAAKLIDHHFKIIFMIRDPRDQTLSVFNWLLEGKWPNTLDPAMFTDELSYEEKVHEVITGERFGFSTIRRYVSPHFGWMTFPHSNILVVRFEDLVGPQGGGDANKQLDTILAIAEHIGLPMKMNKAKRVANKLFGGTNTFRNGQIGQWENVFQEEHKEAFKQVFGQEIIEMGYEQDFEW